MITNIKVHVLGGNLDCDGVTITRASVRSYTDALDAALSDKYPSAEIEIDAQWNSSGVRAAPVVSSDGDFDLDSNGTVEDAETETHDALMRAQEEERRAADTVEEICGRVWQEWCVGQAQAPSVSA